MLDPSRTALLVMDYQAGIIGSIAEADELVARASQAIRVVREWGGHVGYVRVAFTDAEFAAVPDRNKAFSTMKSSGRDLRAASPATAIDERLAPRDGDVVVRKTRVGAFSTTDLEEQLSERGVETLILAGISTSGVVLSTIRDAADRDYRLYVLSDACADPLADVHEVLVQNVFPRQADVLTTNGLKGLLS